VPEIKFSCPHCGQHLAMEDAARGNLHSLSGVLAKFSSAASRGRAASDGAAADGE